MLYKKTLILTLAVAFSVHCSNGHAQENTMSLLFALTVGKALSKTPKPFIEVSVRLGNNQPSQIRLLPGESEESEAIELNDSNITKVCFGDDVLLKPDTYYCFTPDSDVEAKACCRVASDNGSDSEDSDENNDNCSNEDKTETKTDAQYVTSTFNPFRVSDEINQYCATLELKKIKKEPVSDSEIATESKAKVTEANSVNPSEITSPDYCIDQTGHLKAHKESRPPANQKPKKPKKPKVYQCDHGGCNYSTDHTGNLKNHKQKHLPADQRPKVQHCDHEGCNFITNRTGNLKAHKRTHLPANQRSRLHQCDHEDCNYRTDNISHLKRHKQAHLPADQRPKPHKCDHEGCNYRTDKVGNLKSHKQTHLPADQRPKPHKCDHEGCNYGTEHAGNLNRHKQTHLPADQKPERPKVHQCHHEACNYITDRPNHLKRHKQTHLPADQRPKRKAYDQPPPNKKRKKGDKE
ncbi:hypothetical protein [Endozoicomonas sp. 4G]|uniref:hypothetical protein n=1 Tax=Endozoicomonas sp. 4G TaxID=2872754 RepID=UPI002078EC30|nr:hypothetical protein [Endozoicomonas sp. 4G]